MGAENEIGKEPLRVLLVEDNPGDAGLIIRRLKASHSGPAYEVVHVETLGEARRELAAWEPAAILLDLGLPDATELNGLRTLASGWPAVPIVVLTGRDDERTGPLAVREGAQDFLLKDRVDSEGLWRALSFAIERQQGEALRERLFHANRLASIGQLATGIAHEVNNPAAYVVANQGHLTDGLTELERKVEVADALLQERIGTTEAVKILDRSEFLRALEDMKALVAENAIGLERIRSILADLKGFARTDHGEVQMVDLVEVVESACKITRNQLQHRAKLIVECEPVPPIAASHSQLCQVIANLLINAGQAIGEGAPDKNFVRVSVRQVSDHIHVEVEDSGCGVSEQNRAHVLEPFFTTKRREQGTGLGLALCVEAVASHRGEIILASSLNEPTRFLVRLPLETGRQLTQRKVPTVPPPTERQARILLVDDEPKLLRALGRILGKSHNVVEAGGGAEALSLIHEDGAFDLVICDLMMQDVDGVEVWQRLHKEGSPLTSRMVFISGGVFTERAQEFIAEVNVPVLEKPISGAQLLSSVQRLLSSMDEPAAG